MSLLEYFKNIEYHVPNNTDDETSNSIKKYQELGSQSHADAAGDKSAGKKPRMVQPGGKLKRIRNKSRNLKLGGGSKCQSFDCPSVQYNNGSSLDQATKQINSEQQQQIKEANQVSGKAPPAKGGRRRFLHNTNKNKKNIYSYNIMRSKKRNLKGGKNNYPVDKASMISAGKQWTNSKTSSPSPSYNGGLYGASTGQDPLTADGPQAIGPWGTVDVTPTTTEFIQNNLKSATPPPGATEQYVGTSRVGNNYMAMPGVDWYNNTPSCNAGPHDIQGTVQSGGKKRKNNRKKLNSKKKLSKKKLSKKKKGKSSKRQAGGLALYSSNMDCGAPFSPRWDAKFNPANTPVSKKGMNTYTFIQEGGKKNQNKNKNKKNKKQLGGLELRCKNMDCEGPYHPTW